VKAAAAVNVDISLKIIPTPEFKNNTGNLEQNVTEAVTTFITGGGLENTIDSSDVINSVYSVNGVDRVIITLFNKSGSTGIQKSISSGRNEYFAAGTITITTETR
jgi:uncharacterized phage protein gp47/JayE